MPLPKLLELVLLFFEIILAKTNLQILSIREDHMAFESKAKSREYQGVFKGKSRVKPWQIRGIWSQQLEHKQIPKRGTESGVRKGKRSLLECNTRCKCSMKTTHISVKVKLDIKVIELLENLIGWEVTFGQGSEFHLTFVRRRLHIVE